MHGDGYGARLMGGSYANFSYGDTGVMGFVGQVLVGTELDARQREYAASIRSSGEHLLSIINDILDLSKLEAGKAKLTTGPFDLAVCVEARASDPALLQSAQQRAVVGDAAAVLV